MAQLKDVLDRLLDAGELDVYGSSREQLESAAALYAPAVRVLRTKDTTTCKTWAYMFS